MKTVNRGQTNEDLLIQKYYLRNLWLNVYTYKKNFQLNNLKRLIYHKIQPTNQPTNPTAIG